MTAEVTFRYAPIRKSEQIHGNEWMDMANSAFFINEVHRNVEIMAKDLPAWHAANPVVRIGRVRIEEVDL